MSEPRPPSTVEWSVCLMVLFGGIALVGLYYFVRVHGTTPESELTIVEGVPYQAILKHSNGGSKQYLTFHVGDYRTEYSSDHPRFNEVLSAVQGGEQLQVWVSTKQETLFPRQGWVPLYQLSVGNRIVLSYAEVIADKKEGHRAVLIGGTVVSAVGIWAVYLCFRRRRGLPGWNVDQRTRLAAAAIVLSILMYGILIGVPLLDAKAHAKMEEAFGPRPLGLPVELVVVAGLTVFYAPAPCVFWHAIPLAGQAIHDGKRFGIIYVLTAGQHHPELRKSQMVCLAGLIYFAVVCAAWILYTAMRGI